MVFRSPRAFSAIQTRRSSKSSVSTLAIAVVLLSPALALQVAPNSACASLCMDSLSSDASDPNVSNTFGSDVVCKDSAYANSPVGSKFESCLNCLQGSSASSSNENDQGWYFYNLRFAFNSCIFGTANATDSFSTPCSTSTACGPIQKALGDGMGTPTTSQQYSYCSAYDNSFMGSSLDTCRDCLKLNSDASYLSNFLVALEAGCTQRPASGLVVGLNSTVFTKDEVTITFPQNPGPNKKHKSLSTGAIIGTAVGCGILLLIVLAIIFICLRKRRNAYRLKQLQSPLHERFGAENITAPTSGAFSSPQTSPPLKRESVQMTISPQVRNFSYSRHQSQMTRDWQGHSAGTSPAFSSSPPSYSPPISITAQDSLPAHHAYIPPEYTPSSRHSTSPLFVPPPPPAPPPQPSPQQVPRPVPASYPQRSPSQRMTGRTTLTAAPHPSMFRHERNASDTVSSVPLPPLARNMSSASRLQTTNLGARRGFAPSPVVTGVKPTETEDSRKSRERLYREGLGGTRAHGPETPIPERPSPESEAGSEELWPGSY
ncbi:hypothetical protein BKA65DRAFT_512689 [Rhexocercosporidium sp. MPI-PUGE-AT-0058]|nr:hypothetical protein BKA65DRAFT_512689 [Rhexocercosporidium sp. MPI-PUGE-AT-0058]